MSFLNYNYFIEECRIIIAKELNIPPDDINLKAIIDCVERGIEEQMNSNLKSCTVSPRTKEEKKEVWGPYGSIILHKIFDEQLPFGNLITMLKNENKQNKILNKKNKRKVNE